MLYETRYDTATFDLEHTKLKSFWQKLVDVFPQLNMDITGVQYFTENTCVTGMVWTIPEVKREFWEKVILEVPDCVREIDFHSREIKLNIQLHPRLHNFGVQTWLMEMSNW